MTENLPQPNKEPKLKLELDLSDLCVEVQEGDELDLKSIFKEIIGNEVRKEVRSLAREQVVAAVKDFVARELKTEILAEMRLALTSFMTTKILPSQYGEVTAEKYLEQLFDQAVSRAEMAREVHKLAEKWGVELKRQYDIAYANKLVQALNEQGLLLPNVGQLLLDKSAK